MRTRKEIKLLFRHVPKPSHLTCLPIVAALLLAACVHAQTFSNLHSFAAGAMNPVTHLYTNIDGANPYGTLILSGNTLYGTTAGNNTNGLGGLFSANIDGTGFTNFFAFGFVGKLVNGSN